MSGIAQSNRHVSRGVAALLLGLAVLIPHAFAAHVARVSLPEHSPWDQREMALWNLYAGDLFRVTATPTSDWAFGNGVSDIAGFPPDDQMETNFGMSWGEIGNSTLAITISHAKDGIITEADVAVNPNWTWTADEVLGRHYFSPYPFQEIILHELGHVWGLHHPTEEHTQAGWDSVMHVKDRHYYVEELFPDDTNTARSAFPPGVAVSEPCPPGRPSGSGSRRTVCPQAAVDCPRDTPGSPPAPAHVRPGADAADSVEYASTWNLSVP
jgi:hypothetical protein